MALIRSDSLARYSISPSLSSEATFAGAIAGFVSACPSSANSPAPSIIGVGGFGIDGTGPAVALVVLFSG